MENTMSDLELKELGITRRTWNDWYQIMNRLFVEARKINPNNVSAGENEIFIQTHMNAKWRIVANFATRIEKVLNESIKTISIEITVEKNDIKYLTLRYDNNIEVVLNCVFSVIGLT